MAPSSRPRSRPHPADGLRIIGGQPQKDGADDAAHELHGGPDVWVDEGGDDEPEDLCTESCRATSGRAGCKPVDAHDGEHPAVEKEAAYTDLGVRSEAR